MEPPDRPELPEDVRTPPEVQPDRLDYLEARVRTLEERIPDTQLLNPRFLPRAFAVLGHYAVAGFIIYVAGTLLLFVIFGLGTIPGLFGDEAAPEGTPLRDLTKLPVDESGKGTVVGAPTGEATYGRTDGSFVLVLHPTPAGLPDQTTLDVDLDNSTKVYRDGVAVGDAVEVMNGESGYVDGDPTAAGLVVVRFHIDDGRVIADRLELSDEIPPVSED